ncbi:hypothetical protein OCHUTO_0041 [Orientia chuto str. Dubai]|uniref:Uncharacterized protein n=1 Tax=Orientia chuto str. Dubai TaxID=1359168 RepID=A0A0F3MP73_9RICK|nr:hypothetical protein OCHUTO_0041 [Orientia chuto str. Dubai]
MKLLKSGFPNEFVSENTGLSKQEILALKARLINITLSTEKASRGIFNTKKKNCNS